MKSLFFISAFCLIWFGQSACRKNSETEKPLTIASVNGDPISLSQFVVHYNRSLNELDKFSKADPSTISQVKEQTLNKLVFQKLVEQAAKKNSVVVTNEELEREIQRFRGGIPEEQFSKNLMDQLLTLEEWKELYRGKMLAEKVARLSLSLEHSVTEEDIARFYRQHKDEYLSEKTVRASQIYVKDESLAEDLLKRLKKGASFEELAKKHSLSPDAAQGGDLGFFARDEKIPEFNIAFELNPGTIHPNVIKSPYGFHILKTVSVRQSRQMPMAEVRDMIRRKLLEEREETSYKSWLSELVKSADIKKNTALLAEFDKR